MVLQTDWAAIYVPWEQGSHPFDQTLSRARMKGLGRSATWLHIEESVHPATRVLVLCGTHAYTRPCVVYDCTCDICCNLPWLTTSSIHMVTRHFLLRLKGMGSETNWFHEFLCRLNLIMRLIVSHHTVTQRFQFLRLGLRLLAIHGGTLKYSFYIIIYNSNCIPATGRKMSYHSSWKAHLKFQYHTNCIAIILLWEWNAWCWKEILCHHRPCCRWNTPIYWPSQGIDNTSSIIIIVITRLYRCLIETICAYAEMDKETLL